jgi:hypothetical protein
MRRRICLMVDPAMFGRFHGTASLKTRTRPKCNGPANPLIRSLEFQTKIFLLTSQVTWDPLLVDANPARAVPMTPHKTGRVNPSRQMVLMMMTTTCLIDPVM